MIVLKHYTEDYEYTNTKGFPLVKDYSKEIRFPLLQTEFIDPITGSFERKDFNHSQLDILRKQNIK